MSKSKDKKLFVDVSEIWPQERDYLEKPNRFKYVRKMIKPEGCVFCSAAQSSPSKQSLLVFKSKFSMVVLNKYPYNNGHLLVLPMRHVGSLMDLKKREYSDLMEVLKASVQIVKKAYNHQNMNIGLNHGDVAGAGIPDHLHWHIVPRWMGDTNFFPVIAETKVQAQSLEQVFKLFRPLFLDWEKG